MPNLLIDRQAGVTIPSISNVHGNHYRVASLIFKFGVCRPIARNSLNTAHARAHRSLDIVHNLDSWYLNNEHELSLSGKETKQFLWRKTPEETGHFSLPTGLPTSRGPRAGSYLSAQPCQSCARMEERSWGHQVWRCQHLMLSWRI